MVKICAIVGCINKAGNGVSFFCIPKVIQKDTESGQQLQKKRRSLWIKQLKNSISITDHSDTRVCNEHLITRTPNKDESHPDWVPNVKCNADIITSKEDAKNKLQRHLRKCNRKQVESKDQQSSTPSEKIVVTPLLASYFEDSSATISANPEEQTAEYGDHMDLETANTHSKNEPVDEVIKKLKDELRTTALQRDSAFKEVEKIGDMIAKVSSEKISVCEKLHELQLQVKNNSFFINELENDDTKTL
ncbi:hypothetical protein OUZ56_026074 [Daphnia magna]|uniref:THAP-type domain-containing protein n=1 Tax=Daphnia magna TaxID=35525 RepID=A0ABQ9ZKQ2_9CRUS|nr:hypothetical protein OUZ56_026074 [Daphnia magna]